MDEPASPHPESEYVRLARWLADRPSNRDGADKTWVLHLMRRMERLPQQARLLPGKGPDGSIR